jgi:hypothetical protein
MYYDARPSTVMNGMFAFETYECLKGYYSFVMFDALASLGTHLPTEYAVNDIYNCAATNGKDYALILSHYNDNDETEAKEIKVSFDGGEGSYKVSYYILDNEHNLDLFREETVNGKSFATYLTMPLFTSVLVKLEKLD